MKGRRAACGSLLIVTLWMVTILSVLSIAIARSLSLEVRLTRYRLARQQAKALARGGVYLAMQRLKQDATPAYDWLGDRWALPPSSPSSGSQASLDNPPPWVIDVPAEGGMDQTNQRRVIIRITDEERRVPLNGLAALLPLQRQVWFNAVAALLNSQELAGRVADYIDGDTTPYQDPPMPQPVGLESDDRRVPPYEAKNAPMAARAELLEIPGMADVPKPALEKFLGLTSLDAGGALNINTVSPEVLVALGFDANRAQMLQACRTEHGHVFRSLGTIEQEITDCLGGTLTQTEKDALGNGATFGITSTHFTVVSEGAIARPEVHVRVEAVLERGANDMTILSWREG